MEGFDNHEFFSVIYQVFKQNQFMQPGFCFVDCTTFFGEKLHIMVNVVVFFVWSMRMEALTVFI